MLDQPSVSVSPLFPSDFSATIPAPRNYVQVGAEPTIKVDPPWRPGDKEIEASAEAVKTLSVLFPCTEETSGSDRLDAINPVDSDDEFGHFRPPTSELSEPEECFRHSGWRHRRKLTFQLLSNAGVCSPATLESFAHCGCRAKAQHSHSTQRYRVRGSNCHNPWCLPCQRARGGRIAAVLRQRAKGLHCRFITLTQVHTQEPLRVQIDRLRADFATLRHSKEWKAHISGGAVVLEVKLSKSGEWHPHLHMIVAGLHWKVENLKALWKKVTGTSWIVHIKDCGNDDGTGKAVSYVCGYVSKPAKEGPIWENPARFLELVGAMKGRRKVDLLGDWRGWLHEDEEAYVDPGDWHDIGSIDEIWEAARAGMDWAICVLSKCNTLLFRSLDVEESAPSLFSS